MKQKKKLYPTFRNPFIIRPDRPLPGETAVIGAGTIGPDIGYYLRTGLPDKTLYLLDIEEEPLKNAEERFQGYARKAVARRKMKEDQAEAILKNVVYTTDYERIKNCGLVIEAATENLELKQNIFKMLEDIVSEDAILTSNTSSIPAGRIFSSLKHPERSTVTHFFAPAWRSLAVEVVNWEGADPKIIDFLFRFFARTGKAPVITDSVISFMLNRIFENWVNEAAHLLDQATAAQIDSVAQEFVLGGPFFVINMGNGNPIVHEANTRKMEEGAHYRPAPIFLSVEKWAVPRPGTKVDVPDDIRQKVKDRMLGIVFSQSVDISDRIIGMKEDLNFGCQVGLGFRKGPFDIMRDLGEQEVKRISQVYDEERPGFPQAKESFQSYQDFHRFILVDEIDGVNIITIRRPEAMNALRVELLNEILSVLKEGADDPSVKGFVITGYGTRAFCAGADIGKFPETLGNKEAAANNAREMSEVLHFIDQMEKPVVAAVNGMALGGGMEVAIRCHSIVATGNASFQFPEIILGILPGLGGCVVPYRKWPKSAALFHEMICSAKKIKAKDAEEIGMVKKITSDYPELIQAAFEEVKNLEGRITKIPDGVVEIAEVSIPDQPMAGPLPLSKQAVAMAAEIIEKGAASETFAEALEINYEGSGEIACIEASREGITAFLEKRKPEFKK